MLKVGVKAPDFTAPSSEGTPLALSSLRGKKVVLYFFPKAFSPGCTAQAKQFRDNYAELKALGAAVVGVSTDDPQTQCDFAAEHHVNYPLVADVGGKISRDYGVLWPLIGIDRRVTFVIDEHGLIRAVFRHEVQVLKHLDDVVNFLRRLKK